MRLTTCLATATCFVVLAAGSVAQAGFFFEGDGAWVVDGGNTVMELQSDADPFTMASAVYTPDSPMTWGALTELSVDYKFLAGDIGGGSPRFSIVIDGPGDTAGSYDPWAPGATGYDPTVHIHWADGGSYTATPPLNTWLGTGNAIGLATGNRYEFRQVDTPSFPMYANYGDAPVGLAARQVVAIMVALDTGWRGSDLAIRLDNFSINGQIVGPEQGSEVPEPATIALWSILGGLGLVLGLRRRRRA